MVAAAVTNATVVRVAGIPNMIFYKDFSVATTADWIDTPFKSVDGAILTPTGTTCTLTPTLAIGTGTYLNRITLYGAAQTYSMLVIGKS